MMFSVKDKRLGVLIIIFTALCILLIACQQQNKQSKTDISYLDRTAFQKKSSPFIGILYYRPPSPRSENWDIDLQRIKETGIDVIRVWLYWSKVNPRPGKWEWADYDHLFDLAGKNGVKVLLQFMPEGAPYWFEEKYPHARYVGQDNNPIEFYSEAAIAVGGSPGVCVHNREAKHAVEEFIRRAAARYGPHPALYGYDAWNESWLPECYCEATQVKYQEWLKSRYKDISTLNLKYSRSYADFSEIHIPKSGVYADMIDYMEFMHWVKEDHLRWRVQNIQSVDPHHPIVGHWIGSQPYVYWADVWSLASVVDKWGTSCYVGDGSSSITPEGVRDIMLQMNTIRDSAQGKPWWVAEMAAGRVWFGLGKARRSDAEIRMRMILGLSFGAEALVLWQWRPEIFGQETLNFGLTGLEGELTSRTDAVRKLSQMLRTYQEVFHNMQWTPPRVGLVWDFRGEMFERLNEPAFNHIGFKNFIGFYRALIDGGFSVEILNSRLLAEAGVPEGIKVILAPFLLFDREGLLSNLKAWVGKGGTLVAGPRFLAYDKDTYAQNRIPPLGLAEVFGAKMEDTFYPKDPALQIKSPIFSTATPNAVKGHLLMETYQSEGAEVLGTWDNQPSFTRQKYGKGTGIILGSFLGVNYSEEQSPQLAKLVSAICLSGEVKPEVKASEGCISRLAFSGNDYVIFIVNPFDIPKETSVIFSEPVSGSVIDLFIGRELGTISLGKPFKLILEAKEAKILLCKTASHP